MESIGKKGMASDLSKQNRDLKLWKTVQISEIGELLVQDVKNVGLKFNIQKTNIMASGPIISWQIDGEITETVRNFIF